MHLLWKPPTSIVCIAAYIRLVGAVQSFEGDLGTKDFKTGSCGEARDGTPHCTLWSLISRGVTRQAAPELLLLSQRCAVLVGVHLDRPMLESGYFVCWVCTNRVLGMGRLLTTKAPLHGLSICVCSTLWQTLARKMQTVSSARGSLVLTKAYF